MKIRPGNLLLTVIAAATGWLTLLGYFLGVGFGDQPVLVGLYLLRSLLVTWALLLAAVALCIGAVNLGTVHVRKVFRREPGWFYSLFILLGLLASLSAGFVPPVAALFAGEAPTLEKSGLGNPYGQWLFHYVQAALGTALSGLVVFFLVYAGFRLLRRRTWRLTTVAFVVAALVSLISIVPVVSTQDLNLANKTVDEFRLSLGIWVAQVPAVAGARGLLIGLALGAIAAGLRVLLAIDRPYGE